MQTHATYVARTPSASSRCDSRSAGMPIAVCLTGQLRWPELTLAALRQLVLVRLREPSHAFFVGPADSAFDTAAPLLRSQLQVPSSHICAYDPNISWAWRRPNVEAGAHDPPFVLHDTKACRTAIDSTASATANPPPRLQFNTAWLPFFRRCRDARFGLTSLPEGLRKRGQDGWDSLHRYDRARAMPCSGAISLVMQMWQCSQCMDLIESSEEAGSTRRHEAILRLRADIFFFQPVISLPWRNDHSLTWFSLMEKTCNIEAGLREMARKMRPQFFQDFWFFGSRGAMEILLRAPLQRVLEYGLQQAKRSVEVLHALSSRQQASTDSQASTGIGTSTSSIGNESVDSNAASRDRAGRADHHGILPSSASLPVTPKAFAVQPLIYGLHFLLNASHCVRFHDAVGLLRVNPKEGCFGVQTRVKFASLSGWTQLSIANLTVKWHRRQRVVDAFDALVPRRARERLPEVAAVYHRCVGLRSDQSCPRVVGDKMLRNGPAAGCLCVPPLPTSRPCADSAIHA